MIKAALVGNPTYSALYLSHPFVLDLISIEGFFNELVNLP